MKQTTVSATGRTTIPKELRERLDIKTGSKLAWSVSNRVMIVVPIPDDPVAASFGMLKGSGYTFDDFMADRREERELERQADERSDRQIDEANRRKGQGQHDGG